MKNLARFGLAFGALALMGSKCAPKNSENFEDAVFVEPSSSGGGGGEDSPNSGSAFTVVGVPPESAPASVSYVTHEAGASLSTPCSFSDSELTSMGQTKTCYVRANEFDLQIHGIELKFDVPPNKCDFLVKRLYYYNDYPWGRAPQLISYNTSNGVVIPSSILVDGKSNNQTYGGVDSSGTPYCGYDYSDSSGPNCCEGPYTVVADGVSTSHDWGGKKGNCMAGPAKLYGAVGVNNVPFNIVYPSGNNGLSESDVIAGVTNWSPATNYSFRIANYYNETLGLHDRTYGGFTFTKPQWVQPVVDAGGYPQQSTWDAYEYRCVDDANELIARLRVFVMEFNEVAQFPSGDPDTTGTEADGSPSNDQEDLDDHAFSGIIDPNHGSYSFTTIKAAHPMLGTESVSSGP